MVGHGKAAAPASPLPSTAHGHESTGVMDGIEVHEVVDLINVEVIGAEDVVGGTVVEGIGAVEGTFVVCAPVVGIASINVVDGFWVAVWARLVVVETPTAMSTGLLGSVMPEPSAVADPRGPSQEPLLTIHSVLLPETMPKPNETEPSGPEMPLAIATQKALSRRRFNTVYVAAVVWPIDDATMRFTATPARTVSVGSKTPFPLTSLKMTAVSVLG